MKRTLTILIFIFSLSTAFGQHLYPEKFDGCQLSRFCLDCGDTKAQPPNSFEDEILKNIDSKSLKKISGSIVIQVIVDTLGIPCLLSVKNESNIKTDNLKLKSAIDKTSKWSPAISKESLEKASVSLKLVFENNRLSIERVVLDFSKNTNMKSVGTPDVKGSKSSKLTYSWTVFNQQNSNLPWDMSRAAVTDNDNILWFGTDNGIVKYENGTMEIYNCKNSPLKSEKFNKDKTTSIRYAASDRDNNKWFIAGWDVYKYDGVNWTVYDSLNSPINWARQIFVDNSNNVWFSSWDGINKFDGEKWSVIDTTNSEIPSNKALGVFVDSKEQIWIGTFDGNIKIDKTTTTKFDNSDTPLKGGFISKMQEDSQGNLWFSLYSTDKSKAGMFLLSNDNKWTSLRPKDSELFSKNDINDFLFDEEKQILWVALNSVGLVKYDLKNDSWEVYTPENSSVPSIHVMQLTKDKDGIIWGATFAGVIKLNEK